MEKFCTHSYIPKKIKKIIKIIIIALVKDKCLFKIFLLKILWMKIMKTVNCWSLKKAFNKIKI